MAWTTPATATAGSTALTAAFWNTNVRDNTLALPRGFITSQTLATTFTTASTAYTDVTGLSVTFTAEANRRYLVTLQYAIENSGSNVTQLVINDGSTDLSEAYNIQVVGYISTSQIFAITTPSAGSVTYKARIKAAAGTAIIYGTSTRGSLAARMYVSDLGSTV